MKAIRMIGLGLALCAAAAAAPAPAAAQEAARSAEEQPRVRRDRNALTTDEIRSANRASNMMQIVRSLRPRWLSTRGVGSISRMEQVQVYLDGVPIGGPRALEGINPTMVTRARYLDASTATVQYGTDHSLGAILLFTRE